ncbi:MAG: ABC transporter ATP-binding protein [Deltaproteobacteria bacterium]|nr:ABC transporter ATP-binding protein [Nannocystaceae bacterium]
MRPLFHALHEILAGDRLRFGLAVLALVVASCLLYLAPLVPQAVIDGVLAPAGETSDSVRFVVELLGGRAWLQAHLWAPALVFFAITGVAGLFTYLRGRLAAVASENAIRRLRERLYDRLQHLPIAHFDRTETGDLVQRCTSDVSTLRTFLESHVVEIGRALVMWAVPIPLMLLIDVRMTLVAIALVPIVVGFSFLFFLRVRTSFTAVEEAEGRMTANLQENLTGIRVVRAFARQEFETQRFGVRNRVHRDATARMFELLAWFWSLSDLLCMAQRGVLVLYGVVRLGEGTLAVGAFLYFLTAVSMFVYPLRMMGRIVADLGKTTVAVGRLREILDAPLEHAPEQPLEPGSPRGEIELRELRYAHGDGPPALDGVTLHVPAGSTLAIVGRSGAGKSTIVELLLRLRDPSSGSIRLDGVDIASIDRKQVRQRIAVVMPEPFLYSRSIGDNLRFGRPDADWTAVLEATRTACVHQAIEGFAAGYDTVVGERGVTLSGGQRQRIALARALLQRPAVLVLDDALSAVDTRTESAILAALAERRGRHSTILIAHRLSTVMLADRVAVLERGKLVQLGSHDELLAREGPYRRLWQLQQSALLEHGSASGMGVSA